MDNANRRPAKLSRTPRLSCRRSPDPPPKLPGAHARGGQRATCDNPARRSRRVARPRSLRIVRSLIAGAFAASSRISAGKTMDFEQARFNMIEQQIRTWDVLDQEVLDLLFVVKREDYVPTQYRALAFADLEIPLGDGASMWPPKLEARVLQTLALKPHETVLEVGTGSGYMTALLASVAGRVTSVEINPRLSITAQDTLARNGIRSIELAQGDASRGWQEGRYDAIVLTASTPVLDRRWLDQLNPGGRLFAVVGDAPAMRARFFRWTAPDAVDTQDLFETVIAPLMNAPQPERFVF
jgi:protein-L-isoaspartate(D-aspartate) O-methyltransferase